MKYHNASDDDYHGNEEIEMEDPAVVHDED